MIRIGTRDSALAQWQARQVQQLLADKGIASQLVYVKSEGDVDLTTPLYEMGVEGIFTRVLDTALLQHDIDLAVHSMKDVPTQLAHGLVQAAVLERGATEDVVVHTCDTHLLAERQSPLLIATSSLRRQAQWRYRYPNSQFASLRGNMQTRLDKLYSSAWHGAIFAQAGLERIGLLPANHQVLHWMLPAPAQGAIMVVCREADYRMMEYGSWINDEMTAVCVKIERDFLRGLMGGCSMPISALAEHHFSHVSFIGNICLPDGSDLLEVSCTFNLEEVDQAGYHAAEKLLQSGGRAMLDKIGQR